MNIIVRHLDDKTHRAAKLAAILLNESFNSFVLRAIHSAVAKEAATDKVVALALKKNIARKGAER